MRNKNNKNNMLLPFLLIIIITSIVAVYLAVPQDSNGVDTVQQKKSEIISVMTYNVENLFDTQDDPEKKDETYLPFVMKNNAEHIQKCQQIEKKSWRDTCLYLDWSDEVLHQKMSQLARVIQSVGKNGADILILEEVENITVLQQLTDKYLHTSGYQTVVLKEGRDVRGIDVAIVSRFPMVSSELHYIPFQNMNNEEKKDTRGILDVYLQVRKGLQLRVFANHFPAPFHSYKYRQQGFEFLNSLAEKQRETYQLAAGDFNVPSTEDEKYHHLSQLITPTWKIAHQNCQACKGTYYYPPGKNWSFLDMILLSPTIELKTVEVVAHPWMLDTQGYPKSFVVQTGNGVSDHLPLYAEFKLK